MKILIIANNIDGNVDGIGKHARIVGHELALLDYEVEYSSRQTFGKSKLGMIVSLEMSKAYLNAMKKILSSNYDFVDVEYPFMEYNPIILLSHIILWLVTRIKHTRISFSMHEHDRVHVLRRIMIDCLLPFSDLIFVSEDKYFKSMPRYAHKMRKRIISSNGILFYNGLKDFYKHDRYCYFGLVNSSKAFKEMLDAWAMFNEKGIYHLDIVSTTDLTNWNLSAYKGIEYHYNLSNDDAGKVLSRCIFSIIPVIPEIGYNNSSFVSTAQCGCIPIGKFNYELKNEKFTINVTSYDKTPFVRALEATQSYDIAELKEKSQEAISFGKNFSASKTAQMMSDAFKEFAK